MANRLLSILLTALLHLAVATGLTPGRSDSPAERAADAAAVTRTIAALRDHAARAAMTGRIDELGRTVDRVVDALMAELRVYVREARGQAASEAPRVPDCARAGEPAGAGRAGVRER